MDRKDVKDFIREVLGPIPTTDNDRWVSFSCPLAPWTHERGADRRPSAGISVGDTSLFNCFTCHRKGPLTWLLMTLQRYTGEDWGSLHTALKREEFLGASLPEWGSADSLKDMEPLDEDTYLGLYEPAEGHPYLRKRGITDRATRKMNLVFDPGDGGEPRIVFPVYGLDGRLYGFSGRAIRPGAKLKVKDYYGLQKRRLLLGAHLVDPADEYVILVEGLFDYARLVSLGFPALAMMSSSLTTDQVGILEEIGKPVYFFHDNDPAGLDARSRARDMLCRLPMMKVRYPREATVETPEGDLRPPKDPAELNKDQVLEMVGDARLL